MMGKVILNFSVMRWHTSDAEPGSWPCVAWVCVIMGWMDAWMDESYQCQALQHSDG